MSWQKHQEIEAKGNKTACKIRKRGGSSSSSSSLIQKYRFKRAILVGKRAAAAGSTTPVPTWKTATTKSPSLAKLCAEFSTKSSPNTVAKTKEATLSARKLAATLWEINTVPSSPQAKEELEKKGSRRRRRRKAPRVAKMAHTLPPNLSDPSYSPISEVGFLCFISLKFWEPFFLKSY